jgi:hypothetical protein
MAGTNSGHMLIARFFTTIAATGGGAIGSFVQLLAFGFAAAGFAGLAFAFALCR